MSSPETNITDRFDVVGPLPEGVTLLEASAGTGKTYAIAALAARYVADGVPIEKLLLVTFGRMATGELRERVRDRLVSVEAALAGHLAGAPEPPTDEIATLLTDGDEDTVQRRRDRLADAISNFDAATIATIHAFCQEMLAGLGADSEVEDETEFTEDMAEMVEEVIDDLYVRRFAGEEEPRMKRAQAAEIARIAIGNPDTVLAEPDDADPDGLPSMRRRLAKAARTELDRRKRIAGLMTYDDLLGRLHAALEGEAGDAVAQRLAQRYSVVLVDEFQDTDPIQWGIFRRAFGETGTTLVLIGDPKQAIYAFRGADVYAYLEAARHSARRATLRTNWRSDQGLLDAYDALFRSARLGHDEIVYRDVRAAPPNQESGLIGAPDATPLRVRLVSRDDPDLVRTQSGLIQTEAAREHIAADLAGEVVDLLSSGAEVVTKRADDGTPTKTEGVRPGHLAVLVPTNRIAGQVREALDDVGVKAVINGSGSVFGTEPAQEWLRLLKAIERPSSGSRAHGAALTSFLGWSVEEVAEAEDADWGAVHRRLHAWGRILRDKGVASLLEAMTIGESIPERILADTDGERRFTDLRHIGQLLHEAASAERLGVTGLVAWLHARIEEAPREADEERSRRLESDEEAVQVLTIHRSKGLEFPVVYAPFLWHTSRVPKTNEPIAFHDPAAGDERRLDVCLAGASFKEHHRQAVVEDRGEHLRLAYVALTRARHQAVIWWVAAHNTQHSPLERLLFARDANGRIEPDGPKTPSDAEVRYAFDAIAEAAPGRIAVEESDPLAGSWSAERETPGALEAATFDRDLDPIWRRTSYSDIASGAYELRVASEPEVPALDDEPVGTDGAPAGEAAPTDPALATRSLMAGLPTGVRFGTFVHETFERIDFAAPDLRAEVETRVAERLERSELEVGDPAALTSALEAVITTPLGPELGDRALRDFGRADRLDELHFELPLAGGDDPTGKLQITAIADVLREHLPTDDPLASYAEALDEPGLRRAVRGYLTGSLDLVLRTQDDGERPRFAIFDYKTNWLAAPGEELAAWHHRPNALRREMSRGQYGLQAILYLATLHRYLRWRLSDYDPETDLAGVYYLFVRGMSGPETPMIGDHRCGVFGWRPPGTAVEALSDVMDGVAA
ncbi:UvrD-helicase domain-containing protein [Thermoleophilia bacterium SCSIO 60948]|nr:UvrD-helicase domain-containing protein [Thermoleophilia bacterium SCSIO 60948]